MRGVRRTEVSVVSNPAWPSRLLLGAVVTVGETLMLAVCGMSYPLVAARLSPRYDDAIEIVTTVLITLVAPALAFWLLRTVNSGIRTVSWRFMGPVILANIVLVWLGSTSHFKGAHPALIMALSLGLPFAGAVWGSFTLPGAEPTRSSPSQRGHRIQ